MWEGTNTDLVRFAYVAIIPMNNGEVSSSGWRDKVWWVWMVENSSTPKEGKFQIFENMGESRGWCIKWHNPGTRRQVPHHLQYKDFEFTGIARRVMVGLVIQEKLMKWYTISGIS